MYNCIKYENISVIQSLKHGSTKRKQSKFGGFVSDYIWRWEYKRINNSPNKTLTELMTNGAATDISNTRLPPINEILTNGIATELPATNELLNINSNSSNGQTKLVITSEDDETVHSLLEKWELGHLIPIFHRKLYL